MLYDYYEKSFGVYLVGYIRDYKDYQQLETIIKIWSESIEVHAPFMEQDLSIIDEVLNA